MTVGVIDYGAGNLGSVMRALEALRAAPVLLTRTADLDHTDRLVLPGVGNFADCMQRLRDGGWIEPLRQVVLGAHRPLLGICVGMQMLADESSEGSNDASGVSGLGFIPGRVEHLRALGCNQRVPHVGWNAVAPADVCDPLFEGIPQDTDFYFVHSFAFRPAVAESVLATADYGVPVTAAVRHGQVWGTQFHPEKSSRAGFRVLQNFLAATPC